MQKNKNKSKIRKPNSTTLALQNRIQEIETRRQ